MRVFFSGGGTGGHLYPGLAIARALVRRAPQVVPHFIGAQRGIEREVLPTTEFSHTLLELHPLYRSAPWRNWRTVTGGVQAWRAIGRLAAAERPAAVIGTGGYAAGAALAWGHVHRVPLVLHECDSFPGKVTRWFAPRAAVLSLGFPEATRTVTTGARTRVVPSGNPIAPPAAQDREAARARWGIRANALVLLIVGGSQGSAALNEAVAAWVRAGLPDGVQLIWATGRAHHERFVSLAGPDVRVVPYLAPIADAYAAADLALTRAGAMTIAELCAWGIPSVLVPLPTAAQDHQTHNARTLASAGACVHLPQSELGPDALSALIGALQRDPMRREAMTVAARTRGRPHAAAEIADIIATHVLKLP
ncbi:MAG: UDP-N-acetylglucosamine--N-acetylmuramyl-(pentapeptide) pyrophosphoryl-undecaprenol N-acetylglucosamine transferase [Gemmatimonadaceae bacterium]|nr:UDP-N-acetylglucosamine--N-acetylmuramyl-(pentapeptide) pyrophosphoryl-undecaprenol N-acetylglucosamine transferase [Gemmatimonadaceae bacterium]